MEINTLPGPEDMVLVLHHEFPRLIVSCSKRNSLGKNRIPGAEDHGFGFINLATDTFQVFEIEWKAGKIDIRPHGIDTVILNGELFLYAISHKGGKGGNDQVILKFHVEGNRLIQTDEFNDPLLISPNDIAVLPDGSFYCSNDSTKKSSIGKIWDQAFNTKSSNIVYCNIINKQWSIAAKQLSFANGVLYRENKLYVTCVKSDQFLIYETSPGGGLVLADSIKTGKGLDNISFEKDNSLLVPAHRNNAKFILHYLGIGNSPTEVIRINVADRTFSVIYPKSTKEISCGSTAIVYNDHLYISQIFRPYVLKTSL